MKKTTMFSLFALLGLLLPINADAQGIGGLLKKGKQTVENGKKVVDALKGQTSNDETQAAAGIIVNGIEVMNPISTSIEVEPVGLYGVSRTDTKGDAYLVMKVKNKTRKESALFGSSINNQKMMAADDNGNVYNIDSSGAMRYDTPEDMVVKIVMSEPAMMFMDVKKSLSVMPVVKVGLNLDATTKGNLTFKNVPIYWDVDPE